MFFSLLDNRQCKFESAIERLNIALNFHNNKILGMIYYHLFINYSQVNNSELAYTYLVKALDQFKLNNNFIRITECISHFGIYACRNRSYKLAESYFNEAIKLAKILNNKTIIGVNYTNLSWCKICEKEYEKVQQLTTQAKIYIEDNNLFFNEAYAYYKLKKDNSLIKELIQIGKNRVEKKNILYDEFTYLEFALDNNMEDTVDYLCSLLKKIVKKASRDDYFLLLNELLDMYEALNNSDKIIEVQKYLMKL